METEAGTNDQGNAGPKKPTLYSMVLEALASNKTPKGLSLKKIKSVIVTEHPDTQENFSNKRLQTAVKKGLDSGEIIRPKSSEQEGFKGYFLLNRTLIAQKAKKKKITKPAGAATTSDETGEKPKKVKSTKEEKPGKSTTAAAVAAAAKPAKKAKTAVDKDAKKKTTTTTTTKSKVAAPKKKPLAAKASNSSAKSTPKGKKRRGSILSTPKISKADKTKAGTTASKRFL